MDSISITGAKILYTIPVLGGIRITETQVNSWLVILFVARCSRTTLKSDPSQSGRL